MRSLAETRISRASFTIGTLSLLGLVACRQAPVPTRPTEIVKSRENELQRLPHEGDIVIIENRPFLLKNNKRYPLINSPQDFLKRSQGDTHGKKIFSQATDQQKMLSIGDWGNDFFIDPGIGNGIINYKTGTVLDRFHGGMLTDSGQAYNDIDPRNDTFYELQDALEKNGRKKGQNLYGTYGVKAINGEFKGYSAADTIVLPEITLKRDIEAFEEYKELSPGSSYNLAGHSLGGWSDFWVAVKHPHAINNLILLSAPIRGIEKTSIHQRVSGAIKKIIWEQFKVEEQVSDYMYDLWKDRAYQKKVDKALEDLQKAGVVVKSYGNAKDIIVPYSSSHLEGVTKKIGEGMSVKEWMELAVALAAGQSIVDSIILEHSRTRDDPEIIREIVELFGKDLSVAA